MVKPLINPKTTQREQREMKEDRARHGDCDNGFRDGLSHRSKLSHNNDQNIHLLRDFIGMLQRQLFRVSPLSQRTK